MMEIMLGLMGEGPLREGQSPNVDCILLPTTGTVAPLADPITISGQDEVDPAKSAKIMQFSHLANLCGLPSVTLPVTYSPVIERPPLFPCCPRYSAEIDGSKQARVPVSMQFIGKPWDEDTICFVAAVLEAELGMQRPAVHFDLLAEED